MDNGLSIPKYQKEDYLLGTEPFEWLNQFKDNRLKLRQLTMVMSEHARSVGIRNFITLFKEYQSSLENKQYFYANNTTNFEGQELELECGNWQADDFGITAFEKGGHEVVACNHPILPIQRLVNVDSGIEKLKLAYRKGKQWRSIIVDKKTLASNNSILQLADYGVAVNSDNAKYLSNYLKDIECLNYDRIEELSAVGRLGWIYGYGFSPYVDQLIFDGNITFKHFFESVKEHGKFEKWKEIASDIRRSGSVPARIALASSFASVLVAPLGALPFFVHFWGTSETGKTVALLLATSVWANPKQGEYWHSFNSTNVAQELSASFVNSMPLILDELQIVANRKDFDNMIYTLTEGVGRVRGQRTGGLQKVGTWQNCILTTGETPITNDASGGGAVNRIIEIECNGEPLFSDPKHVADTLKKNYGFAGRMFVERLQEEGSFDYAREVQKGYIDQLSKSEKTEKQSLAASVILTADRLLSEWLFDNDKPLSIDDIKPFLRSMDDISANLRAFNYLNDCIAMNENRFNGASDYDVIWGVADTEYTYIIKSQFDKIMYEGGFNAQSVLSWMKRTGKIKTENSRLTKKKRINNRLVWCVFLKKDGFEPAEVNEEVPFVP